MSREIMQQALNALKHHRQQTTFQFQQTNDAIKALEQELAKPEPQVCCGDYEKCWKACTPRGRWLAEKELAKPDLSIEANRVAYDVAMHYANKTKETLG
jgi:hypothetical protein